jgi:hypothetical protein
MSISTRIPTGPIHRADFCYAPLYDLLRYSNGTLQSYIDPDSTEFFSCASAKTPNNGPVELKDSDFQAFCCDGHVIGWAETDPPSVKEEFAFEDLTCCRLPASRTHMADLNVPMTCSSDAIPTPLASLAATGTAEAQPFEVNYEFNRGAFTEMEAVHVEGGSTVTGILVRETPYCVWIDTVHGVSMTSVEVPKAEVKTLPPPGTTAISVRPIGSSETSNATQSQARSTSVSSEETQGSRTSGAGPEQTTGASTTLKVPVVVSLGVLFVSWLVSV